MTKIIRCPWSEKSELYIDYHDREWGVPVKDEQLMFECLSLEAFQAGLSWYTILVKRENFRLAFDQFQIAVVAQYGEDKINELVKDAGIVRHRKKIEATINNAQKVLDMQAEGTSLVSFFWDFVEGKTITNTWRTLSEVPSKTLLSDRISKALKKKGFKFVGSTTIYSHLQAVGIVNDHLTTCFKY